MNLQAAIAGGSGAMAFSKASQCNGRAVNSFELRKGYQSLGIKANCGVAVPGKWGSESRIAAFRLCLCLCLRLPICKSPVRVQSCCGIGGPCGLQAGRHAVPRHGFQHPAMVPVPGTRYPQVLSQHRATPFPDKHQLNSQNKFAVFSRAIYSVAPSRPLAKSAWKEIGRR
ncbi:hypothetical protein VTK26DRAFT_2288 [Humicola hyalothermophila]